MLFLTLNTSIFLFFITKKKKSANQSFASIVKRPKIKTQPLFESKSKFSNARHEYTHAVKSHTTRSSLYRRLVFCLTVDISLNKCVLPLICRTFHLLAC